MAPGSPELYGWRANSAFAMNIRIFAALVSLSHGLVLAEGLPLNKDRTRCEVPHQLLKLNDDQLEEVTVVGTLTLTREQWKQLRAINPAMPKRIDEILPCTYNDCSCGIGEGEPGDGNFGIWFKNGTVAVVVDAPPAPFSEWTEERKNIRCAEMKFRMDERGQFYENGKLVGYSEVKARTAWIPADAEKALWIDIPPHLNSTAPALAGRLSELRDIAKAAGRHFMVFWSSMPGEE
jgi:hypothetical protein